jgi:hypothetical protein
MNRLWKACALLGLLGAGAVGARADEGMWLYNALPTRQVQAKYGFRIAEAWAAHLQRASVHVGGASGSFVSADGLVMTNHHVGLDTLQKLSTAQHNYVRDGFTARARAEEARAPDLEINVLDSIVPVTDQVQAAFQPGMTAAQAFRARRAAIAAIEKDALGKTGLHSSVVALFGGARYDLYRYKRYTDVRLVMAPEQNMAFFGGDPDNFEYPRYDLDMCFFRVYENGRPAQIKDYLGWSKSGARNGDLVFVSGHPGRTARLNTVTDLAYERDFALPLALNTLRRREVLLTSWGERLPENARIARQALFGTQNTRKLLIGELRSLQDPAVLARKQAQEQALRARVAADPKLQAAFGDAWNQVDQADATQRALSTKYGALAGGRLLFSGLFGIAQALVQLAQEGQKPNRERLPEDSDANRASRELSLLSPAPVYPPFERLILADSLALMEETLGANDPLIGQALGGKSPQERASELIGGTKLADLNERKRLMTGGLPAIQASPDPMIRLAVQLAPALRALRKQSEDKVASIKQQAYPKIAQAQLAASSENVYPDATGTLRLSYGTVSGYTQDGAAVPASTTMGGLFPYAAGRGDQPPYQLSPSWLAAKPNIRPDTPFDFVCTADIVGGNSGSPVVDRGGAVVGLIFDGNIQSLGGAYAYTDTQGRSVAVHSEAIIEALRHIYGNDALADELLSGHAR